MPRGQCTLPTDDAGRVLDRLAGLEQVIRPDAVQQALTATGRVNSRKMYLDPRSRPLGGARHGIIHRIAHPTGLQTRPSASRRRAIASSLEPLCGTATVGRGPGAAPVRPRRPTAGPAEDPGGVLPRPPPDGYRRHGLRCPRLGGQRGRLRPPLGRAARRRAPSLKSASSAWSNWGRMPKSPWWCGPRPMASSR